MPAPHRTSTRFAFRIAATASSIVDTASNRRLGVTSSQPSHIPAWCAALRRRLTARPASGVAAGEPPADVGVSAGHGVPASAASRATPHSEHVVGGVVRGRLARLTLLMRMVGRGRPSAAALALLWLARAVAARRAGRHAPARLAPPLGAPAALSICPTRGTVYTIVAVRSATTQQQARAARSQRVSAALSAEIAGGKVADDDWMIRCARGRRVP